MTAGQVDPNTVLLGFLQEWTIMGPLVALLNCGHISKCWDASPVSKKQGHGVSQISKL